MAGGYNSLSLHHLQALAALHGATNLAHVTPLSLSYT